MTNNLCRNLDALSVKNLNAKIKVIFLVRLVKNLNGAMWTHNRFLYGKGEVTRMRGSSAGRRHLAWFAKVALCVWADGKTSENYKRCRVNIRLVPFERGPLF